MMQCFVVQTEYLLISTLLMSIENERTWLYPTVWYISYSCLELSANKARSQIFVASFPGSHSIAWAHCYHYKTSIPVRDVVMVPGLLPTFLHSCDIKSESGLGIYVHLVVYLMSFMWSGFSLLFSSLLLLCIILNTSRRLKNEGCPGTRLRFLVSWIWLCGH